jgi:Histidine kinase-, DNA gyrase B-, and HSP90-like ATPase/GAF domain
MQPYYYCSISRKLIRRVTTVLQQGRSAVLLGPPRCGKGYVRRKVLQQMELDGYGQPIRVDFLTPSIVSSSQSARQILIRAMLEAGYQPDLSGEGTLAPLANLESAPILVASNLDALAHHVARQFLAELRTLVLDKKVVALVSGEYEINALLYGPNSEFNVAEQFVIQSYDLECFADQLQVYIEKWCIHLTRPLIDEMWRLTGGCGHQMSCVLDMMEESKVRARPRTYAIGTLEWLHELLPQAPSLGMHDMQVLRHVDRLVRLDPTNWDDLERLLCDDKAPLPLPASPPGVLTLSGLAIRTEGELRFSSPLMRDAARRYFDSKRLGDLRVQSREFEKAFQHYEKLTPEERLRPADRVDVMAVSMAVRSMGAELLMRSGEGAARVQELFAKACKYLLGFPDIAFWQKREEWGWLHSTGGNPHSQEVERAGIDTLALGDGLPIGELVVPQPWAGAAMAYKLMGISPDQPMACLVGDLTGRRLISEERQRLLSLLFTHFVEAHGHAVKADRTERRLKFRSAQVEIVSSILHALGSGVLDIDGVLNEAARVLRTVGYERIAFTLVDPLSQTIGVVLDHGDVGLLTHGPWDLREPGRNVHPYVVATRKPLKIKKAEGHPLTTLEAVRRGNIQAMTVVPIFANPDAEVVGTIHFERTDRELATDDEVEDFVTFGRQLGALIAQGQRVSFMQSALNKVADPLLIFDSRQILRYANFQASEWFWVKQGWQSRARDSAPSQISEYVSLAAHRGRVAGHRKFEGPPQRIGAYLADQIKNWRGEVAGVFVNIRDLTADYRILEALGIAANAPSFEAALAAILEALKALGHEWGRLYTLGEPEGVLYSKYQFGFTPAEAAQFEGGRIQITRDAAGAEKSWKCIDRQDLLVYQYTERDEELRTELGLDVIGTSHACDGVLRKKKGDYWIDAPLRCGEKVIGKISLGCNGQMAPDDLDFLRAFFHLVSRLLDALQEHENSEKKVTELKTTNARKDAERKALGSLAHTLATQVAGLSGLPQLYQRYAQDPAEIEGLNGLLAKNYEDIRATFGRAKDAFTLRAPECCPVDLNCLVKDVIEQNLFSKQYEFAAAKDPVLASVDRGQVSVAIKEIVGNAISLVPSLHLDVVVESVRHNDRDWSRVTIQDNGPGFDNSLSERIFEEFYTSRPEGQQGTGLGLYIVKQTLESHGGYVRADGTRGARFELYFPTFNQ